MIRFFSCSGPLRSRSLRIIPWCLAFALLAVPAVTFAAQNRGLVVTPLDEGDGDSAPSPLSGGQPGGQPATAPGGQSSPSASGPAGTTDTAPGMAPGMEGGMMPALPEQTSYKDGIVMAYLVELMRKQDKPCPSGIRPPVPPSLLFSEPLCRVAEAVAKGAEFPAAYDEQGIYAARWRMFSASALSAQTVATRLRAEHCEALLEPYTHIGAWRGSSGWRIVLATLTDKPQPVPASPATVPAAPDAAQAASAPVAGSAVPAPAPVPGEPTAVPAPDTAPAAPDTSGAAPFPAIQEPAPATPDPVPAQAPPVQPHGGQEARALFSLINDLRVNGGSCLGRARVTAPPLAFSATLQVDAEKSAADAAAWGASGSLPGASEDQGAVTSAYPGATVSKLTAVSRAPVSAVLDVWMISPTRCDALLSSDFTDAGVAYVDGYWVVLLGRRAGSVPAARKP